MTLVDHINEQLAELGLHRLTSDQVNCLNDPARLDEAAGMLDDLAARCGVRPPLPKGNELPTAYKSEEEAREEASAQAMCFEAVCVEGMATDGRTRDTDEFYVVTFTGPDAALAAICRSDTVAVWVAGKER